MTFHDISNKSSQMALPLGICENDYKSHNSRKFKNEYMISFLFLYSLYISVCSVFIRLIGLIMVVVFYKRDDWWIGYGKTQHCSGCLILRYDCPNTKYGTNNLQLEKYGLAMIKIMRSVKEDLCCTLYAFENSCR